MFLLLSFNASFFDSSALFLDAFAFLLLFPHLALADARAFSDLSSIFNMRLISDSLQKYSPSDENRLNSSIQSCTNDAIALHSLCNCIAYALKAYLLRISNLNSSASLIISTSIQNHA